MAPLSFRALTLLGLAGAAAAVTLSVANSGGNATSPYMYGIMFEDINQGGDGGLYAELIRNRAFQNGTLESWSAVGGATLELDTSTPLSSALPHSVKVTGDKCRAGLKNPGYWGIDVKTSKKYTGSFYSYGEYNGNFRVSLVSDISNQTLAVTKIKSKSVADAWTEHTYELLPTVDAANSNNSFVLEFQPRGKTELKFNLISLFPPTYNNRPNGMRPELMEKLKELNPSFLRIPGGNNIEGNYAGNYQNWTTTVGPLTERPGRMGVWTYFNTDGLGLVEYMHWAEDLDVEVVLAFPAGLALNGDIVAKEDLGPFIQLALDELEFLTGDVSTPYGALRAELGYPEPWKINFVEVGNEDNLWGGLNSYKEYRLQMFYDAIKAKYPDIFIFSSTTEHIYKNSGQDWHLYTRPDWFVSQFGMFDNYADGHPIIIGEYATVQNNTGKLEETDWDAPKNAWPNWIGSVAEAVYSIGAERNGDRVWGATYAPLFQNLNSYQWAPDLISFTADPSDTTASVSHAILSLLSATRIRETLPVTATETTTEFGPAYYVAGRSESSYILKAAVYNSTDGAAVPFRVGFEGVSEGAEATLTVLTAKGGDPFAYNTPASKDAVVTTVTKVVADGEGVLEFELPDLSVAVLVVEGEGESC